MQVYCRFLRDDGYCSKGQYCEFSHDKAASQAPCKFFTQNGNCRYGKSCSFAHTISTISSTGATTAAAVSRQQTATQPVPSLKQTKVPPKPSESTHQTKDAVKPNEISSAWGFDSGNNDDGVYFYGAPGTFQSPENSQPKASYAGIAKSGIDTAIAEQADEKEAELPKKPICTFFLAGSCKFGSFCRNSHEVQETMDPALEEILKDESSRPECGICISLPEDSMYGMLNNCDCSFCLKCIRGWRKDGADIVKDNQQLRKCPLCRRESYFICPSTRVLKGQLKELALNAYKESMKRIPCKVRASLTIDVC